MRKRDGLHDDIRLAMFYDLFFIFIDYLTLIKLNYIYVVLLVVSMVCWTHQLHIQMKHY